MQKQILLIAAGLMLTSPTMASSVNSHLTCVVDPLSLFDDCINEQGPSVTPDPNEPITSHNVVVDAPIDLFPAPAVTYHHLPQPPAVVSTVPIPAAIWLFGVGFMGLVGVARRK